MDMSERRRRQTDLAKRVVSAATRAFYDDSCVAVVDYLLRSEPGYVRDGRGMGNCLNLPTKQLRGILEFLKSEHLVNQEVVRRIVETHGQGRTYRRKRSATFWHVDLCAAVHTIRLRLHLLRQELEMEREEAATSSKYACPGYHSRVCNGMYTEIEVQYATYDAATGKFYCRECENRVKGFDNPDYPPHLFALELVDNSERRENAERMLRRLDVQLRSKTVFDNDGCVEGRQLRPGIYELLQRLSAVSNEGGTMPPLPVTSNLPSENGAEMHLADDPSQTTTTTFEREIADEFAGLVYFRSPVDGKMVALDVERIAGPVASERAGFNGNGGGGGGGGGDLRQQEWHRRLTERAAERAFLQKMRSEKKPAPAASAAPVANQPPPPSSSSTPPVPRPAKMTCRQTTPFFLKENGIGPAGRSFDDLDIGKLERATSQLSVEGGGGGGCGRDTSEAEAAPSQSSPLDFIFRSSDSAALSVGGETRKFLENFRSELAKRPPQPPPPKPAPSAAARRNVSGSSCNSVAWEDC